MIVDLNFTSLQATGKLIQSVTSTFDIMNMRITDIYYNSTAYKFYKISIVNESIFRAKQLIMKNIRGPLFYVSSSEVSFKNQSEI